MKTAPINEPKGKINIIILLNPRTLNIKKISDIKLIEGGAEILEAHIRNINKHREGNTNIRPLLINNLRLETRS